VLNTTNVDTSPALIFSVSNMSDGDHQLSGRVKFNTLLDDPFAAIDSFECVVSLMSLRHKNSLLTSSPLTGLKTYLEGALTFSIPGQKRRTYLKMRSLWVTRAWKLYTTMLPGGFITVIFRATDGVAHGRMNLVVG